MSLHLLLVAVFRDSMTCTTDMDLNRKRQKTLWEDTVFTDVEVACGDKTWKLHSAQLAMASEVFSTMLTSGFKENLCKQIEITDSDPDVVGWLLEYVYTFRLPWSFHVHVSGAGSTDFNGLYQVDGASNGLSKYKKIDGEQTMHFDGRYWRMGLNCASSSQYWHLGYAEIPCADGWSAGLGDHPTPSVKYAVTARIDDTLRLGELAQCYMMPELCMACIEVAYPLAQKPDEKVRLLRIFKALPKEELHKSDLLRRIFRSLTLEDQLEILGTL